MQDIDQSTTTSSESTSSDGFVRVDTLKRFEYPLILDYAAITDDTGATAVTTTVEQSYVVGTNEALNGFPIYSSNLLNQVNSTDTLDFDASGNLTGTSKRDSSQRYESANSLGYCYDRLITSEAGLLTSVKDEGCPGH